jgi:hypothetical protein
MQSHDWGAPPRPSSRSDKRMVGRLEVAFAPITAPDMDQAAYDQGPPYYVNW